jgi:uncharacterized protein (DUF1499 family)
MFYHSSGWRSSLLAALLIFPILSQAEKISDMKLKECPDMPNCVSSQTQKSNQSVAPLSYSSTSEEALARIKKVLLTFPRAKLIEAEGPYLHVLFITPVFRFRDDVEVLVDEPAKVIHIRSASRLGYWDFGVNARRVEAIRQAFNAAQ